MPLSSLEELREAATSLPGGDDDAAAAVAVVQRLTDREVRRDEASVVLTVPEGDALLPAAVRALDAAGLTVRTATGVPPTLDDVFLALTGRTLREAGEGESEPDEQEQKTDAAAAASGTAAVMPETTGAKR